MASEAPPSALPFTVSRASWEVVVVGGGILGLATAAELAGRGHGPLLVLEKDPHNDARAVPPAER